MRCWVRGTFKSLAGLSRGISNRVSEKLMIVDLQAQGEGESQEKMGRESGRRWKRGKRGRRYSREKGESEMDIRGDDYGGQHGKPGHV